jgi:hypothetical protein
MTWPVTELHWSQLKRLELSPAHFRAQYDEPSRTSPAMTFGTLVHALVLGGDVILYDGDRKGSAWAAFKALVDGAEYFVFDGAHRGKAWQAAKEEAGDRVIVSSEDVEAAELGRAVQKARREAGQYDAVIVTPAEHDRAQRCADAVLGFEPARALLEGAHEVRLRWSEQGVACAGTLDVLGAGFVTDLKTASRAEVDWFTRQADRLGYHAQLAWYAAGARAKGFPVEDLYIVAVEPSPPFCVTPFRLTPATVRAAESRWRGLFERFLVHRESDEWPGYVQDVVDLEITEFVELEWGDEDEEEAA